MIANKLYFVYGSLRKGHYNHSPSTMKFICNAKLMGYDMYSLGPFPYITKSDNPNHGIIGEVYYIEKEEERNGIDMMELLAGYNKEELIVLDKNNRKKKVVTFTMDINTPTLKQHLIKSGNWSEYCLKNGGHRR